MLLTEVPDLRLKSGGFSVQALAWKNMEVVLVSYVFPPHESQEGEAVKKMRHCSFAFSYFKCIRVHICPGLG